MDPTNHPTLLATQGKDPEAMCEFLYEHFANDTIAQRVHPRRAAAAMRFRVRLTRRRTLEAALAS